MRKILYRSRQCGGAARPSGTKPGACVTNQAPPVETPLEPDDGGVEGGVSPASTAGRGESLGGRGTPWRTGRELISEILQPTPQRVGNYSNSSPSRLRHAADCGIPTADRNRRAVPEGFGPRKVAAHKSRLGVDILRLLRRPLSFRGPRRLRGRDSAPSTGGTGPSSDRCDELAGRVSGAEREGARRAHLAEIAAVSPEQGRRQRDGRPAEDDCGWPR